MNRATLVRWSSILYGEMTEHIGLAVISYKPWGYDAKVVDISLCVEYRLTHYT